MCLAVPAKILKKTSDELGLVELEGIQKEVSLSLVPEAKEGDYVIVHVGFALSMLDEQEAKETIKAMEQYREIY